MTRSVELSRNVESGNRFLSWSQAAKTPERGFWFAGPLKRGSITPKIEIFLGVDDLPRQEFDDRVGVNGKRDVFSRWRVLDRGR